VVVKILRPELRADPEACGRFFAEAKKRSEIPRSRNLCPILESDVCSLGVYVCMGFVEGQTLSEWIKSEPRKPRDIAEKGAGVARGLHVLHNTRTVHGDVTATNVVVEQSSGEAVLIDFGLAENLRCGEAERSGDK